MKIFPSLIAVTIFLSSTFAVSSEDSDFVDGRLSAAFIVALGCKAEDIISGLQDSYKAEDYPTFTTIIQDCSHVLPLENQEFRDTQLSLWLKPITTDEEDPFFDLLMAEGRCDGSGLPSILADAAKRITPSKRPKLNISRWKLLQRHCTITLRIVKGLLPLAKNNQEQNLLNALHDHRDLLYMPLMFCSTNLLGLRIDSIGLLKLRMSIFVLGSRFL